MKTTRRASAFSLIEISIVILIIGILVAGVTQSSRLLSAAKLSSARSMTQSAPVSSIKNLALWVETTSESSFQSADLDDAAQITTWKDINPQTVSKVIFTSGGAPKYKTNMINGLPAVCFNNANCGSGTTDHFTTTGFSNLTAGITVFVVIRSSDSLSVNEPIVSKRDNTLAYTAANSANFQLNLATDGSWQFCDGRAQSINNATCVFEDSVAAPALAKNNYVASVVYNNNSDPIVNSTAGGITFFQNGEVAITNGTATTKPSSPGSTTSPLLIGRVSTNNTTVMDRYFKGYIGEIIIFDRALKKEERQSIEDYLGKKWGIKMTKAAL
ncbi:MAG: LamG domain-containing protein [Rickettsiales bacterium]|nr:LamG domain-containing protein [Rickettsiales bacterium]